MKISTVCVRDLDCSVAVMRQLSYAFWVSDIIYVSIIAGQASNPSQAAQ